MYKHSYSKTGALPRPLGTAVPRTHHAAPGIVQNPAGKIKKVQNHTYNLAAALGRFMGHHQRGSDGVNLSKGRFFVSLKCPGNLQFS